MNGPLFEGIHYHIQSPGIDPDLLDAFRTNLDHHDAIYCDDPCDSRCQLILVDTPTGETKFIYNAHGKPDEYDVHRHSGEWDFDALCTHFSRRGTGIPDVYKERRKKVVGVGWIIECLSQKKLLVENRYDLWEVIAEDRNPCQNPAARPRTLAPNAPYTVSQSGNRIPSHTFHANPVRQRQSRSDQFTPLIPHDLDARKAPRLALQGKTPTPIFLASYPTHIDWAKMPPSPPLTAASSMSTAGICPAPRFFDTFTRDPISPRTFFVACQNQAKVELSITTHGGMLDSPRDATFIILDTPLYGDAVPQATFDLLGSLRRSQKPIPSHWIEECVRRGNIVDLEQFIIPTSLNESPSMRRPIRDGPIGIGLPLSHALVALDDPATYQRKRSLSQTNSQPPDKVAKPSGIIRKAVDPRVRPRLSTERKASSSESSTRPFTSSSTPAPLMRSPDVAKEKRQLARISIYDRPDATTLDSALDELSPGSMKDNILKIATSSAQSSLRGVGPALYPGQPVKPSSPNAAVETVPSIPLREAYRPDTPPLPPNRLANPGGLPSHDLARESIHRLDTTGHLTGSSSLAKVKIAPDPPQRLASAISPRSSRMHAPQLQTSAHAGCVPPLSSEVSVCTPSSGSEPTPPTRLGSPSLSAQSPSIPSATITKSSVKSAPSNTSVQEPRWPPRRSLSSANQARLGELVDELDKWLNTKPTEPTDTLFHFLKALDVKKSEQGLKSCYYKNRQTVRDLLLARGHSAATLNLYQIQHCRTYEATDQQIEETATAPPSLHSIGTSPSHQVYTSEGDSDAVDRKGRSHPRKALGERRLKRLINYLDDWLESGFQVTRKTAMKRLDAKAPEVCWTNLYHRKAFTIRTRLLAMGWLEVVLDEADIVGKSDRVRYE